MVSVLVISIGVLVPKAAAQSDKYSKRHFDQYLMERNAEILLARSAAPDSISSDATILVLATRVVPSELCVARNLDMNDVVRTFRDDFGIRPEVK